MIDLRDFLRRFGGIEPVSDRRRRSAAFALLHRRVVHADQSIWRVMRRRDQSGDGWLPLADFRSGLTQLLREVNLPQHAAVLAEDLCRQVVAQVRIIDFCRCASLGLVAEFVRGAGDVSVQRPATKCHRWR